MTEPDWEAADAECLAHLRRLLQIDTTNPPGNELQAALYLESVLSADGIETHLLEPVKGRAALVGRLRGKDVVGGPLLIAAHMDVVGVERSQWTCDPFGGQVRDGFVYGRGAIDDKGMLATNLMGILLASRHLVRAGSLSRDLIFVATPDEEAGGEWGLQWLIDHHPDLVQAEFGLNEGGRIRIVGGKPLYAAVQCTEKVSHVVTVTARGPAGHASIPLEGNAVGRLARAVGLIAEHREQVTLLSTTRAFFAGLAEVWPDATIAGAMRDVSSGNPPRETAGAKVLSAEPLFNTLIRTGISPTVLSAGVRHNVIPSEATATLSIRALPGTSIDDVVTRLAATVGDPSIEFYIDRGLDAPVSDFTSPMFEAIKAAVTSLDPRITTVPYMGAGATESAILRAHGVQTFGLLPFPLDEGDEGRMHGADERVSLAALSFGMRYTYDILRRMTSR
jgi:acetylornithine deacetylase/succinyl-diaminopimelate desuccinylase-like protein